MAIQSRPAYVASVPAATGGHTTTRLVTTASGRTITQTVPAASAGARPATVWLVGLLGAAASSECGCPRHCDGHPSDVLDR